MKKIIAALALTSIAAFAAGPGVDLKVGMSNFSGKELDDSKPESAISWGVGGHYGLEVAPNTELSIGALYAHRGFKTPASKETFGTETFEIPEINYSINYIDIPVRVNYSVTPEIAIGAGLQYSLNLNGEISGEKSVDLDKMAELANPFSILAGATYKVTPNINVGLAYQLDLTSSLGKSKSDDTESSKDVEAKGSDITLTVGYNF